MKKWFLFFVLFVSVTNIQSQPAFVSDSLDVYVKEGLKDWKLPGLALVVVKDGKVHVMKGYGVRDIVSNQPVDENTIFFIASNTKLFTGTALALLEFRNKLSLNDKMTKHFPQFKLYDNISTQLVTIRDMLTHRIGTKTFQGDFTFWNTNLSRDEIIRRMRYLKPVGIFRQDYGYCNSCFLAAGQVIPKVTGQSWEQFITDSILSPLEMTSSTALSKGVEQLPNVATPYTTSYSNELRTVPYDKWDNLGPAASILSNVKDLAKWLQFQLDSGKSNGKQVLPWTVLQRTRDVNIITSSRKSSTLPIHFRGYGLGLFAADYNGRQVYWHTGGAAGMVSVVAFVPEENLGIAVLTNNDNQSLYELLRYQILDAYLNVPFVNRSKNALRAHNEGMDKQVEEIQSWKKRVKGYKPALPLPAYTGVYSNTLYGTITITERTGKLHIRFNNHDDLSATLEYMDTGQWLLQYNNIEYGIFATRFVISQNRVQSISIQSNEFVEYDPYIFVKQVKK